MLCDELYYFNKRGKHLNYILFKLYALFELYVSHTKKVQVR